MSGYVWVCLDLGYDHPTGAEAVASHHYVPPLRSTTTLRVCTAFGKEQLDLATAEKRYPARRWVVERTLAWLSKCRAMLMR